MEWGASAHAAADPLRPSSSTMPFSLRLVGGFSLERDRQPIPLPISAQRLVAYVALQDRPSLRSHVAGTLWPDSNDARAMGNLRSVLWRLRRGGHGVIADRGGQLALAADVLVDVRALADLARRILDEQTTVELGTMAPLSHPGDLLPDWSDDWVPVERERFHQLRLHALESACGQLVHARLFGQAVDVCLAAVAEEPLRESAQRQLIGLYLAEGNRVDAIRQYEVFRRMLTEELGIEPSREIRELVGSFGSAGGR